MFIPSGTLIVSPPTEIVWFFVSTLSTTPVISSAHADIAVPSNNPAPSIRPRRTDLRCIGLSLRELHEAAMFDLDCCAPTPCARAHGSVQDFAHFVGGGGWSGQAVLTRISQMARLPADLLPCFWQESQELTYREMASSTFTRRVRRSAATCVDLTS